MDRFLGFQWDFYFVDNRNASSIINKLKTFFAFLDRNFHIKSSAGLYPKESLSSLQPQILKLRMEVLNAQGE
ncbi:hypothetical protein BDW02DRAFT_603772 [Decorospora gaudefroyi]|uniref:Uncharacterized protein n=1 Tax=Decorospora gaudefroyi TaxID=184978 RepID=A0A6A5JXN6_9PLEO|nr:hypothetical protein BDW02DRAFT_603772 [Decorospora gaudefroyi]